MNWEIWIEKPVGEAKSRRVEVASSSPLTFSGRLVAPEQMSENEPIPNGAERVAGDDASAAVDAVPAVAEEIREETPVIDVHAPHGGLHTWKDFWIHLGTITLGLLIAISLEQSVEWMHRLHERSQLQEDLRSEALTNHDFVTTDVAIYDRQIAWLLELQRDVEEARATAGKAAFLYPERPEGIPDSPHYVSYHVFETEAWTTAKESSLLVLLPRAEAEIYARVYIQSDQVTQTRERVRELGIRQGAFETRFANGTYPPDLSQAEMTPQDLNEYETILADELEAVRIARVRLRIFGAANDYVLSGGTSESELRQAILKANVSQ
jgi:hypothetical protein